MSIARLAKAGIVFHYIAACCNQFFTWHISFLHLFQPSSSHLGAKEIQETSDPHFKIKHLAIAMAILNEPEHHEEAFGEILGAAVQQQPMQEAQAKAEDKMTEDEKKALQIHNQGRVLVFPSFNTTTSHVTFIDQHISTAQLVATPRNLVVTVDLISSGITNWKRTPLLTPSISAEQIKASSTAVVISVPTRVRISTGASQMAASKPQAKDGWMRRRTTTARRSAREILEATDITPRYAELRGCILLETTGAEILMSNRRSGHPRPRSVLAWLATAMVEGLLWHVTRRRVIGLERMPTKAKDYIYRTHGVGGTVLGKLWFKLYAWWVRITWVRFIYVAFDFQ